MKNHYQIEQNVQDQSLIEELNDEQLEQVAGGINAQPLPPGLSFHSFHTGPESERFSSSIIFVGGTQE